MYNEIWFELFKIKLELFTNKDVNDTLVNKLVTWNPNSIVRSRGRVLTYEGNLTANTELFILKLWAQVKIKMRRWLCSKYEISFIYIRIILY